MPPAESCGPSLAQRPGLAIGYEYPLSTAARFNWLGTEAALACMQTIVAPLLFRPSGVVRVRILSHSNSMMS
jgi:hypothetical protein